MILAKEESRNSKPISPTGYSYVLGYNINNHNDFTDAIHQDLTYDR